MGKFFEILLTAVAEVATWQSQTRARRGEDPLIARWRELHRLFAVAMFGALLMFASALLLWWVWPTSPSPAAAMMSPAVTLVGRAAMWLAGALALMACWFLYQILNFDRWPHDFNR